jgi:conjugative transfer signal peptidase TraF
MTVRRRYSGMIAAAGLALAGTLIPYAAGYRLNVSASLPPGIWRVGPLQGPLERGQIGLLCAPPTAALKTARQAGYVRTGFCPGGFAPLLKPIAALPGDHVSLTASGARVNGVLIPNTAPLARDGEGRPLPRVPHSDGIVRQGEVWVLSDYNPASFDSRYLGPVPLASIRQAARPVLIATGTFR